MQKGTDNLNQRNIHAILQQRRLRHVNGLCIRNLKLVNPGAVKTSQKIYFTICNKDSMSESTVIYKSDGIDVCANPSWLGFTIEKTMHSTCNILHLELWMEQQCNNGAPERLLAWNWDLLRLRYVAEHLYNGEIKFAPNALILRISGSFYSFAECFSTDTPHGNCPPLSLDEEKVSYNIFSIRRMVTSLKSIAVSKVRSANYILVCEKSLEEKESYVVLTKLVEDFRARNKMLKLLLNREATMLKSETDSLQEFKNDMEEQEIALSERRGSLIRQQHHNSALAEQSNINHLKTMVLNRHLSSRRIEVLSELAYIFPILPYNPPKGAKSSKNQKHSTNFYPNFVICDIHLPDAESLQPKEDVKNAVAMGYVSQMLHMISFFLVIPLRYPFYLQGSQTSIVDNIIDKIQEKDRLFPLYVRSNKERFLFEYGVYLLNKDVAQLRFLLGIQTSDLRPTLMNLKSLLEQATGHVQSLKTVAALSSSRSTSPAQKPSPAMQRKKQTNDTITATVAIDDSVTSNGLCEPPNLEEKVQDKNAELSNLRGELFGNKKTSKPISISPQGTSTNSMQPGLQRSAGSPAAKKGLGKNADIPASHLSERKAPFLTGLEDLENSPKGMNDPKKPFDIAAARNELFKTKSGRAVIPKKKVYTAQSCLDGQKNATYLSEAQVSKSRSSMPYSIGSSKCTNSTDGTDENVSTSFGLDCDGAVTVATASNSQSTILSADVLDLC